MVGMYLQNKKSKVGSMITCPVCGKRFFKKQYSQAFCSLHCKDVYWNSCQKDKRQGGGYLTVPDSKINIEIVYTK